MGACARHCTTRRYEAGAQMAEETQDAKKSSPHGVIATCAVTALVGFCYIAALLFSMPDLLDAEAGDNPVVTIFVHSCGQRLGLALAALVIVNCFFAGMSSLTVTSRIGFAMIRDGAFPYSRALQRVNPHTHTPIRAVSLSLILALLHAVALSSCLSVTVCTACLHGRHP